jgi:ADP-ribose pyrophosphatase YjhB (NUDIX family)
MPARYPDALPPSAPSSSTRTALLVRRGQAPGLGKWSLPGGLLDLGERLEDAVVREVEEESGLRVQVLGLCGVIDRVIPGEHADSWGPAVRYHWVIVDYVAAVVGGVLRQRRRGGLIRPCELDRHETTDGSPR